MIKIIVTFNFSVTHIIYELLSDAAAEAASGKFSEIEIDISPGSTLAYIFAPDEATSEAIVNHLCSPQYSKNIFNAKVSEHKKDIMQNPLLMKEEMILISAMGRTEKSHILLL